MWYGGYTSVSKKCFCLFDCQCDKVEQAIADWTSHEAFETLKDRLSEFTDPTEIFARTACVLFHREILDETMMKCTKDNFKKASIAFSFACSFANEEVDCVSFYASCWQRFLELVSDLEQLLSRMRSRRLMPVSMFIEEVFPLDSDVPIGGSTLDSVKKPDSNANHAVGFNANSTSGASCEKSRYSVDHSISEPTTIPTLQAHLQDENTLSTEDGGAVVGRAPTRSMPFESAKDRAVERLASEGNEKKPQTPTPIRFTIADSTPIATNTLPTAAIEQAHPDSEKNEDTQPIGTSLYRQHLPMVVQFIDRSNWHSCPEIDCKYKFKFEWMLKRHASHHRRGLKIFWRCRECGMEFFNPKYLGMHMHVHNRRNGDHVCEECDYHYAHEVGLDRHKNNAHNTHVF